MLFYILFVVFSNFNKTYCICWNKSVEINIKTNNLFTQDSQSLCIFKHTFLCSFLYLELILSRFVPKIESHSTHDLATCSSPSWILTHKSVDRGLSFLLSNFFTAHREFYINEIIENAVSLQPAHLLWCTPTAVQTLIPTRASLILSTWRLSLYKRS